MTNKEIWAELAHKIKELFRVKLGKFRTEDFVAVVDLMGFHAYEKAATGERLKLIADHVLPEIIGTNLNYAVDAYEWQTCMPITEDGSIVSGFWDRQKDNAPPAGYEMEPRGRFLRKIGDLRTEKVRTKG